jgi:hypothetical protein
MHKKLRVALILTAPTAVALLTSIRLPAQTSGGSCGAYLPFTDVGGSAFVCQIAEA